MTPLLPMLLAQIAREGPMTLADYMTTCLHHPTHGYYSTRDPLGADGDFITAPEISQMFGELLGLALAQTWLDQGRPNGVLAELGPGRGTLMADALRATRGVPGFHDGLQLCLVENSPTLRARQAELLGAHAPAFFDSIADLPDGPLFLIANEFFDALPIRAFERTKTGWAEWRIGATGDHLHLGLHPLSEIAALDHRRNDTQPGDVIELCPAGTAIAAEIGHRIATQGGAALIIDYGSMAPRQPTFQAVRNHQKVDPLSQPGEADLTAHVDFAALLKGAAPAAAFGPVPQGVFLHRLGIAHRARTLADALTGPALESHEAAFRRLTDPSQMGTLFQVAGFAPSGAPPLPGFDP